MLLVEACPDPVSSHCKGYLEFFAIPSFFWHFFLILLSPLVFAEGDWLLTLMRGLSPGIVMAVVAVMVFGLGW